METQEALNLVRRLLAPRQLSYLEEVLLSQTIEGRLYREIALDVGYELSYVRDVGSKLWSALSTSTGTAVTKKNVMAILKQQVERTTAPVEHNPQFSLSSFDRAMKGNIAVDGEADGHVIKFPGRSLEPQASTYIERPPIENLVYNSLFEPGSLIRIQAPRQMGKTSLVHRVFDRVSRLGPQSPQMRLVYLNLRQVDQPILSNLDRFLRWFCWTLSQQLGLTPQFKQYWMPEVGAKISCTNYMQEYVLAELDAPLVLAFDDLSRLFHYPEVAQDVLPMFRTWHEEAIVTPSWQKLRLLLLHNAEVDLQLPLSQSPFNVGLAIQLPDLTWLQTQELAQQCGISITAEQDDLVALYELVGGQPYLLQLAFHWLTVRQLPLHELLQKAPSLSGIFRQHLRHYWLVLQTNPSLWEAFESVLLDQTAMGVGLEIQAACWLEELGLIRLEGDRAVVSRSLYQRFFTSQRSVVQTNLTDNDTGGSRALSFRRAIGDDF
ncbi:AAA-like domain-containing protein [filamentous cyanobacterium LEGE 11480]|uniref:AAA-like domain-containing protein n=1 Tax=Romeriopsis navalis LEGE 11480 TaxID=2777977 RepID=A0A928VNP6_9CYAN|nr:AAA-like domain-containing protein [Romeriopsis navalis]MBE9031028.1 AAA-like domain-containing protein [Romeriopsis navalis LEGE 11480]